MNERVKRIIERAWSIKTYEEDTETSDCCGATARFSDICSDCGEHAEFK